jgi:hypothetical protein
MVSEVPNRVSPDLGRILWEKKSSSLLDSYLEGRDLELPCAAWNYRLARHGLAGKWGVNSHPTGAAQKIRELLPLPVAY